MKRIVYVFSDFETTGLFDLKDDKKIIYPIEIGLIFTDENYCIYDTYESLIKWPTLVNDIKRKSDNWPDYAQEAYNIHKIDPKDYLLESKKYMDVCYDIFRNIEIINQRYLGNDKRTRFILVSDNIQFEFRLMEFLLRQYCVLYDVNWPFHYSGYDSNELLIKTGIGDPIPEHRALRDASLLLQHMTRALEKLNYY